VLRYNTETLDAHKPAHQYNSSTGVVTVNLPSNPQNAPMTVRAAAQNPYRRWIVEWASETTGQVVGEKVIPMPFYEQVGETCWAADALMLTKAVTPYKDREAEVEIYNFMKALNIGVSGGIGMTAFLKNLLQPIHDFSGGASVKSSNFIINANLRCELVELLKKDLPVILRLPVHTVVVVGYRITTTPAGARTYEFVIHDSEGMNPPNANEGFMYTLRDWTWFEARLSSISNQILWVDDKPHAQRALQTIGLPSHDKVGELGFVYNNDHGAKIKIRLGFSENEPKGYAWYFVNDKTVSIPYRAEELYLNLPVWNADLDQSVAVRLEVKILQSGNTTPAYAHTEDITLGTDKGPHWFEKHIPVCSFSKSTGSNDYTLQVKLYKGSVYQDGYAVDFTMEEGPFICSLSTDKGEAGTAVTITGRGFGATQESSEVTFNGVPAREIVSWSPTSIIARVPGGATNGNVAVTVEGKESNGLPFEVKPTDLVYPVRISFVSGENHNMEEFNNREGLISLGTGAAGLGLTVFVRNQYGGYECFYSLSNYTQQEVIEDTSYRLHTRDKVVTVDLTGAGFLAKLFSDSKTVHKVTSSNPRECYDQTIENLQVEGMVSNGRASGTIHWDSRHVNTCNSQDDSMYYNYSFVPDN
jgi:hypothetical protein